MNVISYFQPIGSNFSKESEELIELWRQSWTKHSIIKEYHDYTQSFNLEELKWKKCTKKVYVRNDGRS